MTYVTKLLSAGAAAALISGATSAQILPIDYSHHWQPMHNPYQTGSVAFSDGVLFTAPGDVPAPAGIGDSIRRCFGTDTTNGGRNNSALYPGPDGIIGTTDDIRGQAEHTWFRLVQAYGPLSTTGPTAGVFSMHMAADSDLTGDVCFSPLTQSAGSTGGHRVSLAATIGTWGAAGSPITAGFVWRVVGQWAGSTTTNFHGVPGPVTIGTQVAGVPAGFNPLLANAIFELQGPTNNAFHQYYLATTSELTGLGVPGGPLGVQGTGGVTNGNAGWGSALFGGTADVTGAINHTRIIGFDDPADGGAGGLSALQLPPRTEIVMNAAWQSPGLWGINNGSAGAGGNDWVASVAPVSTIDLRLHDNLSGAEAPLPASAGTPAAADNSACIVFNQPIFLWSATAATTMQEKPMSWDDLWVVAGPLQFNGQAQPGSFLIGTQLTTREGQQRIPANFDTVSQLVLEFSGLTLGTQFSQAYDTSQDPGLGGNYIFAEGSGDPITSGVSNFSGGPIPIVGTPKSNWAGVKLGIAALGVQFDGCLGVVKLTEVANSLEINLQ